MKRFRFWCIAPLVTVLWLGLRFSLQPSTRSAGKLTVRVVDAQTNQPIPARIVLQSSDGKYPGDRLGVSASGWPNQEVHGVFIQGGGTFELPIGRTMVTAAHGLEYRAHTELVEVEAGKTVSVDFKLRRVVNMRQAGWVAGDMHVHMIHGENQRTTNYADVAATCSANGLDFVYVVQEYVGAGQRDLKGYQAECRKVSTENFRMLLGAERPQDLLGHQALIGVSNPFVISNEPPYYRSALEVHAQGGTVLYVHPVRYYPERQYAGKWLDFPGNNLARELVFDAFVGPSFDGLSVLSDEPANSDAFGLWFSLLNRGLFVPVFADSDACFDRPMLGIKAPGFWTTYLYVGPGGTVDNHRLSEAVRRGRTMATTGPLLQFRIDAQISGATLPLDGKPRTVRIHAWLPQHAFTLETTDSKTGRPVGISKVELIRNGQIVKTWEPHSANVELTHGITERRACWYAVRVFGEDAQWQVAAASPIYFAAQAVPQKRAPLVSTVRGRIYDFGTGRERSGMVEIRRGNQVLKRFPARGQFRVKMPLDARIAVRANGFRPLEKNLLKDYGPIHKFLWYLDSKDLGRAETFERFERLVRTVDLEFPLGYKMPGSYVAHDLAQAADLQSVRVLGGPERRTQGTVAVAAVLMDTEQIQPGDSLHVAAIFRDEGDTSRVGPLVVEARGYDPARPTAFGELKKFAEFEKAWGAATDLGNGYRMIAGTLQVAPWVEPGPTGGIDLSVRARRGNGDAAFVGLRIPLGATRRALSVSCAWPTMPLSWPDRNYGIGPFQFCNRIDRESQPRADYRKVHLALQAAGRSWDLLPARDALGCADADDAYYTSQYLDQVLADQSHAAAPDLIRPQPRILWPDNIPVMNATAP